MTAAWKIRTNFTGFGQGEEMLIKRFQQSNHAFDIYRLIGTVIYVADAGSVKYLSIIVCYMEDALAAAFG